MYGGAAIQISPMSIHINMIYQLLSSAACLKLPKTLKCEYCTSLLPLNTPTLMGGYKYEMCHKGVYK